MDNNGFEVIDRYTRAQAIADGELVDVTETAKEAGIKVPVALTRAAWDLCVALTPVAKRAGNDEKGRLWDVLWMFRWAVLLSQGGDSVIFRVQVVTTSIIATRVQLKAVCGPGDEAEPVITIMLPRED